MHLIYRITAGLIGAALAVAPAAAQIAPRYLSSDDTLLSMAPYSFEGGKTLKLTVGIGSGAFHHPDDPDTVIWTVGDRGPNIACDEMKSTAGVRRGA